MSDDNDKKKAKGSDWSGPRILKRKGGRKAKARKAAPARKTKGKVVYRRKKK
jgi:hypothetical protein